MISFAGTITSLMSKSGLAESFETYGKNTVKHMLTGNSKSTSWALSCWDSFRRNGKVQMDRNNQNVIYDQIEIEEDAICGAQYNESILENEGTSW